MQTEVQTAAMTWAQANQEYLRAELTRLRMLFHRKVRWLRCNWQKDPLANSRGLVISEEAANRLLGGEHVDHEVRYYHEDSESVALTNCLNQIQAGLARQRERMAQEGGLPSLEILIRLFGLTPFDRDLLLLCLAPEIDAEFVTLFAYTQDDVQLRYPTLHLALNLFALRAEEREAGRNALLPGSPLRQFRLVTLLETPPATPQSLRPLRVESRIADYVRGINCLDENVAQFLRPSAATPIVGVHREIVDRLVRWAQSAGMREPWPVFHLTGPTGVGKQPVAREFCACIGMHLYALDPKRLPSQDSERHNLLHVMERETVLSRLAFYLDVSEIDSSDRMLMTITRDWIERSGGVLFVGTREGWQFHRPAIHIPVPKLDSATQHTLWRQSLEGITHSVNGELGAVVQQFDFGPQAISQAVTGALAKARQRCSGDTTVATSDLWQACREQVSWRLGDLAQRLEPCYVWDDIVLPDDILRQLREMAGQVAERGQVYEQWGFGAKLPRGRGISALFSGPSGTGKTMAAEILAKHLQLDLYRIDLAGVVSKYIGETEKNLRNVFDAAEQSGAILFFDEADSLFGKRSEVKDSHDRYANIEVNYLLQRMEDYRGLAILCTNRRSALDRAFLRRLRFLVEFPFPDAKHRRQMWQKVFPPQAPLGELDWDALSRLEISGGNIRNVALNAAFLAAGGTTTIQMEHVIHAARREYAKIDKLITETEFGSHLKLMKI